MNLSPSGLKRKDLNATLCSVGGLPHFWKRHRKSAPVWAESPKDHVNPLCHGGECRGTGVEIGRTWYLSERHVALDVIRTRMGGGHCARDCFK